MVTVGIDEHNASRIRCGLRLTWSLQIDGRPSPPTAPVDSGEQNWHYTNISNELVVRHSVTFPHLVHASCPTTQMQEKSRYMAGTDFRKLPIMEKKRTAME